MFCHSQAVQYEWLETVPANKIMAFGGDFLNVEIDILAKYIEKLVGKIKKENLYGLYNVPAYARIILWQRRMQT